MVNVCVKSMYLSLSLVEGYIINPIISENTLALTYLKLKHPKVIVIV